MLAVGDAAGSQPRVLTTCSGEADWSLPADVQPLPGTGLFTMGAASRHPAVRNRGFTKTWAELNPEEGRYDWAPVRRILERAAAEDFGVVLRLKASVTERASPYGPLRAVPDWVLEKHQPPRARTRDRGPDGFVEVAIPWHPGLQREYLAFVEAFGQQGFQRDERLLGLYVHGISSSFGEELWLDARGYAAASEQGLTPRVLRTAFEPRLRAWARAFGAEVGKLAWVGAGWIDAGDESRAYRRARDELNALALSLGMGRRWGHIESFNGRLDSDGQSVAPDGRLTTDPGHPLVAENRFWGAENENWRGVPGEEAFAYRRAVQRSLQMGMRHLWVSDAGVALDPEISGYFARVAGRGPATSPDAWSVLRATEVRLDGRPRRVGNLERWLQQIDEVPRARTRPARVVERPKQENDWDGAREWTARSTDIAAGQDRIAFELAGAFGARRVAELGVEVTWVDHGAPWRLRVGSREGAAEARVQGTGDGMPKTTRLAVEDFSADPHGPDLVLVAEERDLEVSLVRVLRRLPAASVCPPRAATPSPRAGPSDA